MQPRAVDPAVGAHANLARGVRRLGSGSGFDVERRDGCGHAGR